MEVKKIGWRERVTKASFDAAHFATKDKQSEYLVWFMSVVPYSKLKEFCEEFNIKY